MTSDDPYHQASHKTSKDLKDVAITISHLALPEIEHLTDLIGRLIPAGNVPGVVLNGLARLKGRPLPEQTRRDINALFFGVEHFLDRAVFLGVFAGPAMIIWGYQKMLQLVGKDPSEAFPEGTWQYYADYALREDTARHTNETHGFDTTLRQHGVELALADRMTAWVLAAVQILHQYDRILENEWRERVYTYLLRDELPDLYPTWEKIRPYGRGQDAARTDDYAAYRRLKFDRFLAEATENLPARSRKAWEARIRQIKTDELPAYQRQMSILATLEPTYYHETRTPIPRDKIHIGVIVHGQYYLIPAFRNGSPVDVSAVRELIAGLLFRPADHAQADLTPLARVRRSALPKLELSITRELDTLRLVPILINFDRRPRELPLAELRQAERGIGSHPLTLFDTGETMVFDQSHIFFDGAFGAALAEIFTNEALAWAVYLNLLPPAKAGAQRPYAPNFALTSHDLALIERAPQVAVEVSAENENLDFAALRQLRLQFKQHTGLNLLTVNDLLVLYRAIHAATYEPDPALLEKLRKLRAKEALEALKMRVNPATMIPVDASRRSPRDRVYPMSFEVPLKELDLLNQHQGVLDALAAFEKDKSHQKKFVGLQRSYLAILAAYGQLMSHAKEIALSGESASSGTIKFLAHMPKPLQKLLDDIPAYFDVLNDIIKGREVFSNVGAVVPGSTLTRFITAKDDNEKKTLAWSVITDAEGIMRLGLRDFRPHVSGLINLGQRDLAQAMTQDYLDSYVQGFNQYIRELRHIHQGNR